MLSARNGLITQFSPDLTVNQKIISNYTEINTFVQTLHCFVDMAADTQFEMMPENKMEMMPIVITNYPIKVLSK